MRNVFLFLRRYSVFFAFLVLQIISLSFLFSYNRFHRAKFLGIANEVTGRINTQYNRIEDYFNLKQENRRLHHLNDSLLNLLQINFLKPDSAVRIVKDTIPFDTLGHYRRYLYRDATVVYNTVSSQKNYFQLNRGSKLGIRDNMAVISSDGYPVGIVVNVSNNFSEVMSLLHVQNTVNASLKKGGEFGTLQWDGKDPRYLSLKNIPKSADVKKGDTILTSTYSYNFPPGFIIGTVADISMDNVTGFFTLKVKTAADFFNLQQVHVIENLQYDEQVQLFNDTRKKIEQPKSVSK
ncbi:MAG: rod shape-determining protein MreC [Chitinophagaceae bacterium]|jgi:rod shape-determining protein MreC|nr:rod shape-determining protein MreC [Chitinophagaceae bacterium]OQY93419.1 MAG: rod shape-determining protein MreC [Sphingobacteriales bacterium UTBCD1]